MENKKKTTIIRDAIALFLITLISGLALGYVYEITKEPIAVGEEKAKVAAYKAVFPEAKSFEEDAALNQKAKEADLKSLNAIYEAVTVDDVNQAYDANQNLIGYIVQITTKNTYKDPITFAMGYSMEGKIQGIKILSINETPGLGMKAKTPDFIGQYLNKQVDQFTVTKTGSKQDSEIDAISGATITSRGVTYAIDAGIGFLKEYSGDLGGAVNE